MKRRVIFSLLLLAQLVVYGQRRVTVSGYVRDEASGETLIGALVRDTVSGLVTTTNAYGFYSLSLPPEVVGLVYSYVGYLPEKRELKLTAETKIDIGLQPKAVLGAAVVRAERSEASLQSARLGVTELSAEQVGHTPALLGETDVMRTIQLLPGVQTGMNGAAGLYVRGGGGDENLIMLDGVPIYKVDHLFGFFSVFTPEAMKKVTFYKNSFPARYAGRASSVVDVRTKDGNMQHWHGSASLGLLTGRINLEGPLWKDHTSMSFSARTTYIDLLMKPFMSDDDKFGYKFYDLNLKLNHRFSYHDRLFLSLYQGQDRLTSDYTDSYSGSSGYTVNERYGSRMHWGNMLGSLRWNHVFSSRLFSNTTVAYNEYDMTLRSYDNSKYTPWHWDNMSSRYHSLIRDLSAALSFEYHPHPNHRVEFGTQVTAHRFRPESMTLHSDMRDGDAEAEDTTYAINSHRYRGTEAQIYIEDEWKVSRAFSVLPALVGNMFRVEGKSYHSLQPRLSLRWQMNDSWMLKSSYTEMEQYVHLLTSMPIAMPTDLWVPITRRFRPERARQLSVGTTWLPCYGWELSAELYAKRLSTVLEYRDGMSFVGFSGSWQELVSAGTGRSYGLELMARKTWGRTTGWLAYTLSKSDRKFSRESGVNDGRRFPFTYDRRHVVNLLLNHKLDERTDLDLSWMFHSGEAATVATQKILELRPDGGYVRTTDYVPGRNNYRLPCSHTLSVGVNRRKVLKGGVLRTWNVSLYNAYNAMNPTLVYRKTDDQGNIVDDKLTKFTLLPCIPSFTLTYKF